MRSWIGAASVLLTAGPLGAQAAPDLSFATPIEGDWSYSATPDGSDATFSNVQAVAQLSVHCTRATRRVTIARPSSAPASLLTVWTSSLKRDVPPGFNPTTGRLVIDLAPFDPLLDAMANSRGRIGFIVGTQPALVVPSWAEPAHVIEDCRS